MKTCKDIYNLISNIANNNNLKINHAESIFTDNSCGFDMLIDIEQNVKVKFFKYNETKLYSYVLIDHNEYSFNLADYKNVIIYEIEHNYKCGVGLINFIVEIQRGLGFIPKDYIEPKNHKFINGKMIY